MTTVTIGCKLPNGLHLDYKGVRVTLNGSNSSRIVGGYGFTSVSKDFWDAWSAEYKGFPPLEAGLIFAQNNNLSANAAATEQAGIKSGFEPIDPQKPAPGVTPAKAD